MTDIGDKVEITTRGLDLLNEDDLKILMKQKSNIVTIDDLYPVNVEGLKLEAYCEELPGAIIGLEGIHWNKI